MKKLIILGILLGPLGVFSQTKDADCSDGACSVNFVPETQLEKSTYTFLDVGTQNDEDILITTQNSAQPRSIRLYVEGNDTVSPNNLSINLSATSSEYNAGDIIVVADLLSGVTIDLDGYQGPRGKDASQLCAEKYKLGSAGGYGDLAKAEFEARRLFDPGISSDRCSPLDIVYLQENNFTCSDGSFTEIDANNPVVTAKRLKGKTRCIGLSFHDVCLSKSVEVLCTWKVKYLEPVAVAGQFSTNPNDSQTKSFTMPEKEWLEKKNKPGFIDYLCNVGTSLPGDPPAVELLNNPAFNFGAEGWSLTQSSWSTEQRRVKTLGGINQVVRPSISQTVSTTPGKKYRVKGSWFKAIEEPHVSTGRISIWADASKSSLIEKSEFYEPGAVGNVHFNSNPTYHHFNYIQSGALSSPKAFALTNEDDRPAVNCSSPYLFGGDSSHFSIITDNCGSNDLAVGQSCVVEIRANPLTNGRKSTRLKRDCTDDYGSSTTLDTLIEVQGYSNYPYGIVSSSPLTFNPTYTDGEWWRLNGPDWQTWGIVSCNGQTPTSRNGDQAFSPGAICTEAADKSSCSCTDFNSAACACSIGYYNKTPGSGLFIGNVPAAPAPKSFPLVLNSQINSGVRQNQADLDFVFTATGNQTLLEYSPILKFNSGYVDNLSVVEVSANAGPSVPPEYDVGGNPIANVAGAEGNGYYQLAGAPNSSLTSPGFDPVFFSIPDESDWRIRYVQTGNSCPTHFDKIKTDHLSSIISFDEDDELCDDIESPEDPEGLVIDWTSIGFDRLPEFGTESVQCRIDNCSITSQVRDIDYNLDVLNPSSGTDGTQQGGGSLFVYDVSQSSFSGVNGSAGPVGSDDINELVDNRICAKIQDAQTQGVDSQFAAEPVVLFQRHIWQALKVKETGNFGNNPINNGKKINIFKKLDSSVRYFLKNEVL